MFKSNKSILKLIISICALFCLNSSVFAYPLDNWQDEKAYKPTPILFLHGFAKGNPEIWKPAKAALFPYFSKYQQKFPYLETINFQDSNGSVDTYPNGEEGWSDKVDIKVNELLDNGYYGSYANKLNLVCHSMGGLSAREYVTNFKYASANYANKLVLIGVPNLGSPLADSANYIARTHKFGWGINLPHLLVTIPNRYFLEVYVNIRFGVDINGEAAKDMDTGSQFLKDLNSRGQPSNVNYYGIYGIIGNFANWYMTGDYYGGDGVASKESQLGGGKISFRETPRQISASHADEPVLSVAGDNPLLKFLDSAKPEFEITSPNPSAVNDINTTSLHLQGKVYKEYLPADSQLIINVVRESDGLALPAQTSFLKPSDLWIPNNPDSPVAEFDEIINFPGKGKYKVSCQIKNPANLTSDIKETWVNIIVPVATGIIVHCHNPEGKEIDSIQGVVSGSVAILDGIRTIFSMAINAEIHGVPLKISPGIHTIKAVFNGMTLQQEISLQSGQTQMLTFTFPRVEKSNLELLTFTQSNSASKDVDVSGAHGRVFTCEDFSSQPDIRNDTRVDAYFRVATLAMQVKGTVSVTPTLGTITGEATSYLRGDSYCSIMDVALMVNPHFYKPINILPTNSFTNWYIQNKSIQESPVSVAIISEPTGLWAYLIRSEKGYYCTTRPASLSHNKLIFVIGNGSLEKKMYTDSPTTATVTAFRSELVNGENLKFSSVPYDLLGNAV